MKKFGLIFSLALLLVISGCNNKPEPNVQPQEKVISTYLEGIQTKKADMILKNVSFEVYKGFALDRNLTSFFSNFEKKLGTVKSWSFKEKEAYVDELNGQTIMPVNIVTTKRNITMNFDLRCNDGKNWYIYSIDSPKSSSNKK